MSKWQQVKLGDIGKIITGKTPPTANPGNYGGNIPFITPSDMYGWRDIFCTERYLTEQGVHTVKNNVIPSGTVCVSCIGSDMGKVVIARKRCVTNQQINSIIVNDNFDQHFVYYLLLTQKDVIRNLGKNGTAIPILNKSKFSEIKVCVPPIKEQRKIADILSAYDDLIENNRKQIKLLEEAAQRLYKEWFIDLRFPGYENTKIINGIPEGWEMRVLGDIACESGKTVKKENRDNYECYLPIDCLPSKSLVYTMCNDVSLAESSLSSFNHGDIIFGAMRPYFHKIVIAYNKGLTRSTCFVINCFENAFWSFLVMTLFSTGTIEYATQISVGTTMPYVRWKDFQQMPLLIPNKSIAEKFNIEFMPISKKLVSLSKQINALQMTRDRLLPKLMTGELEVK